MTRPDEDYQKWLDQQSRRIAREKATTFRKDLLVLMRRWELDGGIPDSLRGWMEQVIEKLEIAEDWLEKK